MKNNWNKILNELSYRVSSGIPDLTNEQHLIKLWDILKEHNWNIDARVELLKNLDEQVKKRYYQTDKGQKAPEGAKVGVGPEGGTYYWSNPDGSAAKEKDIPLPTDWVVTMVSPIEKVETMYKEDILNGQTTDQIDNPNQSTKVNISD